MQNQQTQQNPQNGTQSFFPMGQGPNNFDPYQVGAENNSNTPDPNIDTQQGSEISSQIGGAAINGAETGASQAETPIPSAQELLNVQTLPNATDDAAKESAFNPEISGMKTEAANIIPFPSQESQSSKDEQKGPKDKQNADDQTQTDGLPHIDLDSGRDSLSEENQKIVENLIEDASKNPFKFYQEATEARKKYSESIRGKAA